MPALTSGYTVAAAFGLIEPGVHQMNFLLKTALALAAAGGGTLFTAGAALAGGFPAPYCTRDFIDDIEPITLVRMSNIDNPSSATVNGSPALEDYTAVLGTLRPGSTYPLRVEGNTAGNFTVAIRAYFDWNQDAVFNEDASERVEIGSFVNSTGVDGKFALANVTIPLSAVSGQTRMRVVKRYQTAGAACGTEAAGSSYGQAEDYTINIDPAALQPPTMSVAFAPAYADASLPTTLTISLGQFAADAGPLALVADLVNTLPAGMTVAATPNASTTCPAGTLTADPAAGTITLATGAQIPPTGCSVSVDVQVAGPANYANSLPSNALRTTGGNFVPVVTGYYQATAPGLPTYGVGFEAPAFGLGNLPQGDWGRGGGVATDTRIVTTNPAAGAQNLRLSWTAAGSTTVAAISPTFAPGTKAYSVASAKLSISAPVATGTDFDFAPQDPAAGSVVARLRFARPAAGVNRIMRLDPNGTGPGVAGYVDTGATWSPGAYFDVKVIANRSAQTYDVCINGAPIVTGAPAFARNTSNIAIIGTKGANTQNNILDADDVVIDNTNFGTCNGLPIPRTVTPSVGTPSGSISPGSPVVVDDGSTTQFTLIADPGFHVDNVAGTCGGSLAGNVFTTAAVTADCTVIANVAADVITRTVTPSVGTPSGTISPATPQVVNDGATAQFTLTADTGFHIDNVGGTCGGSLAGNVFTTAAVTADCTVIANFAADPVGGFVCSGPINHTMAATVDGTSINWATGAILDDDLTGYDINVWNSGGLTMYWNSSPAGNAGVAPTTTSSDYSVLQSGAVIGPASTWSRTGGAMTSFRAGVNGYLGFRYQCTAGTCYGYAHFTTTSATGYPATLIDYCHDTSGAAVTIPAGITHAVTPSVGTPSGTISPATPQTVADGATTQFTLTPDSGFQIDSVGGTCGGALAANVFTTNAVTADCTVIANFVAGGADPVIDVDPASLGFTVDEGASDSAALTIANIGGGTLDWAIQEGTTAQPSSSHMKSLATRRAGPETAATLMRSGNVAGSLYGTTILLGDHDISQTADNAPGDEGVSCGVAGTSTADNSWWRRFYFNEHPAVGASSNVTSVTITSGSTGPNGVPFTVNLYTLPHSTAVNTIPTGSLTLIGTATGTIDSGLAVVNVPVTGAIDDTVGKDLVVEWHTDGNAAGGQFFPGANASAETHPTFLSSVACGLASPTTASAIGFPDFHLVMVVSLTNGGGGPTCQNPADVPWLSVSPAAGSLAGGASQDATVSVDATGVAAGSYSANLCVTSNDPVNPLVNVPVALTVEAVVGEPCSAADTIFCDGFDLPDVGDPDIVTGAINLPVNNDFDGNALDLVTGTYLPWNAARVDDVNFYNGGDGLYVYWYGDAVPGQGGVSSDGVTFDVLQSGATIGPASQIIAASIALTGTWWNGADGYFGIAFMNESTGAMNYGYVHVTTSSPDGYPAQTLEYAYNQAGNPITIP